MREGIVPAWQKRGFEADTRGGAMGHSGFRHGFNEIPGPAAGNHFPGRSTAGFAPAAGTEGG